MNYQWNSDGNVAAILSDFPQQYSEDFLSFLEQIPFDGYKPLSLLGLEMSTPFRLPEFNLHRPFDSTFLKDNFASAYIFNSFFININ